MNKMISILMVLFFSTNNVISNPQENVNAQFPGGGTELVKYIDTNLKYPEEAQKQKWEGQSLIGFTVNEDGLISNIRVIKSSFLVLDNEAMRLIKMMPKWNPAILNGTPKKEMVVLPINFDLKRKNIMY
ncbi:MAG TPA: energy transducer TonB [Chitinophagales bacterium]|jgi:protein TonB|nr:energy transducer TonB [Chitinophagales bacterium]MBP6153675.1 energy transducer TonB [Chitinophagales bacterium]HQV79076.1 energy transducer TonB [Chitinophagales bacterium]HQW79800.1 energy transducer TonB [Chitinophagales bacterium]HRB19270.1 energy transducer TonB [Chitinophagales bacterium]